MFPYLSMGDLLSPTPDYWKFLGTASLYGREWQNMVLCVASIFCNLFVLSHHLTERPHPKFLIHWRRKVMIRVHVACGGFEMLFAAIAFFTARPLFALLTSLWCIGHVITSLYMLSGVFGIRLIMYPAYLYTILLHLVHGILLSLEPRNAEKLVNTFLTLQIYVWVRVVYVFIDHFNVLTSCQYTVSVILAGMIVGPAVNILGNAGNLLVLCFIGLWNMARDVLPPCCSHMYPSLDEDGDYSFDKTELNRLNVRFKVSQRAKTQTYDNLPAGPGAEDPSARSPRMTSVYMRRSECGARQSRQSVFFDNVADQSSHLQVREEKPYSIPRMKSRVTRMRHTRMQSTRLSVVAESETGTGDVSTMQATLADGDDLEKAGAREVFESLCQDPSVGLTKADMSLLLSIWGLPYQEVDYVFGERAAGLADPEVFSFEEFYKLLEPIWHYAQEMAEYYDAERAKPMNLHVKGKQTVRGD